MRMTRRLPVLASYSWDGQLQQLLLNLLGLYYNLTLTCYSKLEWKSCANFQPKVYKRGSFSVKNGHT